MIQGKSVHNKDRQLIHATLSRKLAVILAALTVVFILSVFLALSMGPSPVSLREIIGILQGGETQDSTASTIVFKIRLPRIILAAIVGATVAQQQGKNLGWTIVSALVAALVMIVVARLLTGLIKPAAKTPSATHLFEDQ